MYQFKLPYSYWGECIWTAIYLINRIPSSILGNKCLYELLHQRPPLYNHLKSFGYMCYPTILKRHNDKFEPRTTPHIFVGYPFGTKGYKVLDLTINRLSVSRDVVFHKTVFPFALWPDQSSFPFVLKSVRPYFNNSSNLNTNIHFTGTSQLDIEEVTNCVVSKYTHTETPLPDRSNISTQTPYIFTHENNDNISSHQHISPSPDTLPIAPNPPAPRRSSKVHKIHAYLQ